MYVIDGDTVVVNGEHIRLLAIDAPELHGKCRSEKTSAYQAKGFVQGVLATNRFWIVRKGTGKYSCTLTNLWTGNKTLSEFLLNTDLARKYAGDRKPWGR
ncbi:MAG: nuclease [Alphaproteobacteria bacterium]|nr:MAG: nuclease [Alphaproteobacteria bacterium]